MNPTLPDPAGMLMSEKLDGVRALWTGERLLSRHGRDLNPPTWFIDGLPPCRLDGELWMGNGSFDSLVTTIQRKKSDWQDVRYMVFDLAQLRTPIEARHEALALLHLPLHVQLIPHRVCRSQDDLDAAEVDVVNGGGEGLVLRRPCSLYRPQDFIKVKRLHREIDRSVLD